MTKPLRYIKNQFVKLSRGTLNGLPLLMPGKDNALALQIEEIFQSKSQQFNIVILALNVEPFGYQTIVLDPQMRRSDFLKAVNQAISMKVKKSIKHTESVWSNCKPGNVPILDWETLEQEIYEICISPVKRGYVRKRANWILPKLGPSNWTEKEFKEVQRVLSIETENETEMSVNNRGPGSVLGLEKLTELEVLRSTLETRIMSFEYSEKRRRKKVLGVKLCRKKTTFLRNTDQYQKEYRCKEIVLCSSIERTNTIIQHLKSYYTAYLLALRNFIDTGTSIFPLGILKMRVLFKLSTISIFPEEPFYFVT